MSPAASQPSKLAVVGAGSAGLASLFHARRQLPDWEITCFDRGERISGAWGDPHSGFVSTSTKYATQFSCYRKFDAIPEAGGDQERADFFRDDEYGRYLRSFAEDCELTDAIRFSTPVERVEPAGSGWQLTLGGASPRKERFDALILATGLAERPREIRCPVPQLLALDEDRPVREQTVVVLGGGESAVDMANRLAAPELGNRVYLSLRSGIRVSPRYHPIRGVPSDFLRTRLMLSIHRDVRTAVGQKFVEARIHHQELFERLTGRRRPDADEAPTVTERRKAWAAKLTHRAKDDLFSVYHNKSDDFLDAIAEKRLTVVGPPLDESYRSFADFDDGEALEVRPDLLVPTIGFTSALAELSGGALRPRDFYWGCVHPKHESLFLVGFARPILGNIPSISEMQARYVAGLLAGQWQRPGNLDGAHHRDRARLESTFPKLDTEQVYPVEMFPYCDDLARAMGTYPRRRGGSLRAWLRTWLGPASTVQYRDEDYEAAFTARQPAQTPPVLVVLLLAIKMIDSLYDRLVRRRRRAADGPAHRD